jgi:hypothetical protein
VLGIITPLVAVAVAIAAPPVAELRAGRAAVRITPQVGIPMGGSYSLRLVEGTADDLLVKAVVFELNGTKAALVSCDLIAVDSEIVEAARKLAQQQTGIAAGQIMISATHTHTGPLIDRLFWPFLAAQPLKLAQAHRTALPGKIAESIRLADAGLTPARVWRGLGREDSISFYRRYLMKDGTVVTSPGKLNEGIVQPVGEIDPDTAVVHVDTPDNKPLATYVNYALHPDTMSGPQLSADYPATLARVLAKLYGPEALTLFTIGAAGNINHIDVRVKDPQKGPAEARRVGTILAGEVIKTMARLKPAEATQLRFAREVVALPAPKHTGVDIEKAKSMAALFGRKPGPPLLDLARAFRVLEGKGVLEAEVQVIALGDKLAWVGLPGEIFVELGMAIKKASPFPQSIIVGLANGSIRYVPTRKAFAEGGYETAATLCSPGGGEILADAAIRLLAAAYRGSSR